MNFKFVEFSVQSLELSHLLPGPKRQLHSSLSPISQLGWIQRLDYRREKGGDQSPLTSAQVLTRPMRTAPSNKFCQTSSSGISKLYSLVCTDLSTWQWNKCWIGLPHPSLSSPIQQNKHILSTMILKYGAMCIAASASIMGNEIHV
jgi:hypothetical protein